MPTQTESQLPIYSSIPANLSAVTVSTASSLYAAGFNNGPGSSTTTAASVVGATTIAMTSATSFYQGEAILIDGGKSTAELVILTNIATLVFTVQRMDGGPLLYAHASGATVVGTSAGIQPISSGRVNVSIAGTLTGNQTGDTVTAQIIAYSAVGSAGATAGTALPGITGAVQIGNTQSLTMLTGVLTQPFGVAAQLGAPGATNTAPSGGAALTVGVPYLFDLIVSDTSISGKTVTVKSAIWSIEEV